MRTEVREEKERAPSSGNVAAREKKERNVLPSFEGSGYDSVVFAMSDDLYGVAVEVATLNAVMTVGAGTLARTAIKRTAMGAVVLPPV